MNAAVQVRPSALRDRKNRILPAAGRVSVPAILVGMDAGRPGEAYDRVAERYRAVALARHFREAEGLTITQIAQRLGRSPATIKAYFYDRTRQKARAVKARYVGCAAAAAPTRSRATARATPTGTASGAVPSRSSGGGGRSWWCQRCWTGASAMAGSRPPMTGRAPTRRVAGRAP